MKNKKSNRRPVTTADVENGLGDERMVLDTIKGPEDVKRLSEEERKELAAEIREFLIETTSRTGGHLASNLGVVELTIAMYLRAESAEG